MGFRIHRGIFQKLNAERTAYENTFKIDEDGRIKEVDSEGNVTAGYLKVGEQATDADTVDGLQSGSFLRSDASDSFSGTLTGTASAENLKVGGIRGTAKGSQAGQYIHLYERVHIGGPSGWGAATHGAPSQGLSTWGSVDFGMNGSGVIQLDGTTIVTAARALTNVTNTNWDAAYTKANAAPYINSSTQARPDFNSLIPSSNTTEYKEVHIINEGSNFPSGAYTYGVVHSQKMGSMKFQWYVPHTASRGDNNTTDTIYFRTGWGGEQIYGWQYLIHSGNIAGQSVASAGTLTTTRNIALTGAVTGNANFDGSGNISIATTATADPTLTLSGDASGSATFTNLGNATLSVTVNNDSHNHIAENVTGGILGQSGKIALANHPEGGAMLTPSFENDLAFVVERGGNVTTYITDSTDYTALSLNNTGSPGFSNTIPFNGSTNYTYGSLPSAASVVVYDIEMPFTLSYGNTWYVDFGAGAWQAKDVTFLAFHTDPNNSEQLYKVVGGTFRGVNSGLKFTYGSYSYIRTSDGGRSYGYNRLRVVMSNWDRTGVRIAAIGAKFYNSGSLTATLMSRGGGTMYGNLAATGTVTGSNLNISNWDTAYGWGNHASANYLTSVPSEYLTQTEGDARYLQSLPSHTHGIGDVTDAARWWNNFGDNHTTRTGFDAETTALTTGFGWRYVQGNSNSPGTNNNSQFYSLVVGLGNDYNYDNYGMQLAIPRNTTTPYISIRYEEGRSLGAWQKISAGYADSAGAVAWGNVSSKPSTFAPSLHTHSYNDLTDLPTIPSNNNQLTNGAGYITSVPSEYLTQTEGDARYRGKTHFTTNNGYSDYYTGGSAGWYRVAEVVLNSNCGGATLYGTLYDHRYDGADAYQVSIVARSECNFTTDNESHYVNVGCTILGSTNYNNYRSKIRAVLVESATNVRRYEIQFYETAWNRDTWQLQTNGNFTVYEVPQAPREAVGTARINYRSTQNADYQRANTAMYAPIYYDSATGGNSTNWNTAYGWGNHASAGYAPSSHSHHYITNNYSAAESGSFHSWDAQESTPDKNPTTDWFTSLRIGHGHPVNYYSNTLAVQMTGSDLGRIYTRTISNGSKQSWNKYWHGGDFTSTNISNWNTAHGWGNHASAGYVTSVTDALGYTPYQEGTALSASTIDGGSKLKVQAGHNDARMVIAYNHNGDSTSENSGNLVMWTSEPGISYPGSGIGGNVHESGHYYGKRNTNIPFGVALRFNVTSGRAEFLATNSTNNGSFGVGWYVDDRGNTVQQGSITAPGYNSGNWDTAYGWGNHSSAGYLTSVPNLAASKITSGTFANARISQSSVTQHQSALSIAASQVSGLPAQTAPVQALVEGGDESTLSSITFNPGEGSATFTLADGQTFILAFAR